MPRRIDENPPATPIRPGANPRPYADSADAIFRSGLGWPLPIPYAAKAAPPVGFTGRDGAIPTAADISAWKLARGSDNVATRLAPYIIGLDIDAHSGKPGWERFCELEKTVGALPPTYVSTGRPNDLYSGINWFQIDPDEEYDETLVPGDLGDGVDVIHFGYRYAVSPPSKHPKMGYYFWRNQDGLPRLPDGDTIWPSLVGDYAIAYLPDYWLEFLLDTGATEAGNGRRISSAHPVMQTDRSRSLAIDLRLARGKPGDRFNDEVGPEIGDVVEWLEEPPYGFHTPRMTVITIGGERYRATVLTRPEKRPGDKSISVREGIESPWPIIEVWSTDPLAGPDSVIRHRPYDAWGFYVAWLGVDPSDPDGAKTLAREWAEERDPPPPEPVDEPDENDPFENAVAAELAKQRIRAEARKRLHAETLGEEFLTPETLDWGAVAEYDEHDDSVWLVNPLVPTGRLVALYAEGKAGKSLLMLDIAYRASRGESVLGLPAREPIRVLYLDYEMTLLDLRSRLYDLGWDGDPAGLSNLHYTLQPTLAPLDTETGGAMLVEMVAALRADLVIVDTLIRAVAGNENESETYADAARYAWTPLKREGVTVVRLDHAGKDADRGQRGSSAKRDDVDVVWRLDSDGRGNLTAKLDATRIPFVSGPLAITQEQNPLRFTVPFKGSHSISAAGADALQKLDDAGVPDGVGRDAARKALAASGVSVGTDALREALRWRKQEASSVAKPDRILNGQVKMRMDGQGDGQVRSADPETAGNVEPASETDLRSGLTVSDGQSGAVETVSTVSLGDGLPVDRRPEEEETESAAEVDRVASEALKATPVGELPEGAEPPTMASDLLAAYAEQESE